MAKTRFTISDTSITTDWQSDLTKFEPRDLDRGTIQIQWQNATGTLDGTISVIASLAESDDLGVVVIDTIDVTAANNLNDNWVVDLTMAYEKIGIKYVANSITSIDIDAEVRSV